MKLHTEHSDVERSGVTGEGICHIKTTAKAFDILSSGIYTDKILAVIRELSCNAYDSHIAAGKTDIPFEVHLPNHLEPWFHVKDNGIGLSDTDVMELYTTYFESTKTHSNNFIGALGLGSKSPFSYTKAFEAISRFNGKRRMYSLFINENGIPSIARMGEINTDECNGFEVKITIKQDDFCHFYTKAKQALSWFPIKPIIVGCSTANSFEFDTFPNTTIRGDGWVAFKKNDRYTKFLAVQANVAYNVNLDLVDVSSEIQGIFHDMNIIGFFENGQLEYAPSREEVRYDERTKLALHNKINDVIIGIRTSIEDQINQIEGTFWNKVIGINKIAYEVFNSIMTFRKVIENTTNPDLIRYLKDVSNGSLIIYPQVRIGHRIVSLTSRYAYASQERPDGYSFERDRDINLIKPSDDVTVFFNDMKFGGSSRVKEFLKKGQKYGKIGLVITRIPDVVETIVTDSIKDGAAVTEQKVWANDDYENEYDSILESLGDIDIIIVSTGTVAPVRAKRKQAAIPILKYSGINGRYRKYVSWNKTDSASFDLTAGGLYFYITNGSNIVFPPKTPDAEPTQVNWGADYVKEKLCLCIKIANLHLGTSYELNTNVIGFPYAVYKKVNKLQNWVNIFDVLKATEGSYTDAVTHRNRFNNTPNILGIKGLFVYKTFWSDFSKRVADLDSASHFKLGVQPLIDANQKIGGNDPALADFLFQTLTKMNVDFSGGTTDTPYIATDILDAYPMLKVMNSYINSWSTDSTINDFVFDYIKLIDRS